MILPETVTETLAAATSTSTLDTFTLWASIARGVVGFLAAGFAAIWIWSARRTYQQFTRYRSALRADRVARGRLARGVRVVMRVTGGADQTEGGE